MTKTFPSTSIECNYIPTSVIQRENIVLSPYLAETQLGVTSHTRESSSSAGAAHVCRKKGAAAVHWPHVSSQCYYTKANAGIRLPKIIPCLLNTLSTTEGLQLLQLDKESSLQQEWQ